MGKSPQFVRIGLQRGILPFGKAVKQSSIWTYHIHPNCFTSTSENLLHGKKLMIKRKNRGVVNRALTQNEYQFLKKGARVSVMDTLFFPRNF
jgi:hypothetical protein